MIADLFVNLNFIMIQICFHQDHSDELKLDVFYTLPMCIEYTVFYLILNLNHVVKIWILKFKITFE